MLKWFTRHENSFSIKTEHAVGDRLYFFYTYPDQAPYHGMQAIVSFTVDTIGIDISTNREHTTQKERYEGGKFGCNYYGIAPAHLVAKSKEELVAKLILQGYTVTQEQ